MNIIFRTVCCHIIFSQRCNNCWQCLAAAGVGFSFVTWLCNKHWKRYEKRSRRYRSLTHRVGKTKLRREYCLHRSALKTSSVFRVCTQLRLTRTACRRWVTNAVITRGIAGAFRDINRSQFMARLHMVHGHYTTVFSGVLALSLALDNDVIVTSVSCCCNCCTRVPRYSPACNRVKFLSARPGAWRQNSWIKQVVFAWILCTYHIVGK